MTRTLKCLAAAGLVLAIGVTVHAAVWITPDWPGGKAPEFPPVPLYWFQVAQCPVVYRAEIDIPKGVDRATCLLRTSGWAYVYVDGRPAYGWAPRPKTDKAPEVPADCGRVHPVDLSDRLAPGRHVLAVSAPADGFVLDGALWAGPKRVAPLATDARWTVRKFPPTTILEDEKFLAPGYRGEAAPVKSADAWTADDDALAVAYAQALLARSRADLDDAAWQLDLLIEKGIYLADGAAHGWCGPLRLDPKAVAQARELRSEANGLAHEVDALAAREIGGAASLREAQPALRRAAQRVYELVARTSQVCGSAAAADSSKAAELIAKVVQVTGSALQKAPSWETVYEGRLGHAVNRLNESRYDRLGWIDHPALADSDLARWGVRINPVTGPTTAYAPEQWRFSTDPDGAGQAELRWSIGYNVETQWATIRATKSWTDDPRFAGYAGAAWYRARLQVPAEWAGCGIVLTVPVRGGVRLWFNDQEIEADASKPGDERRTFGVEAKHVACGGENFLAVRVAAAGDKRGLVGRVEARCPSLEGAAAKTAPPVAVLATPLSPCVVLTPETDLLEIRHAGKARLFVPAADRPFAEREGWAAADGPKPIANWMLLWLAPATAAATERPILLVFQDTPVAVTCAEGLTRIRLAAKGGRVVAVRPWAKAEPPDTDTDAEKIREAVALWSRAALAVPVNYMSVTRVLKPGEPIDDISIDHVPAGPVLGQTVVYDYLETKDAWKTEPLKVAPLPAFCSYAIDCKFRGLEVDEAARVEALQDGGLLAPYRALRGADRASYRYPVEPYPRFVGFTSWMFSGVDTGVPGNRREIELAAAAGANSYRPQHNWSDELPPKGMWPADEQRTRVRIMADACNAFGVNYMNNIDQTLGKKQEYVREHYAAFMDEVGAHYEKIARQLADRPFWAVAYDLINEPFDHKHAAYNPAMKELTRRVRAIDRRHLCYIEPCEAWGAVQQLDLIEPTGDPLTVYSFHDYNFRLSKPTDRWPTLERDVRNIHQMWLPAYLFAIRHGTAMHCGEFGGFRPETDASFAQTHLMNEFFRIFDQFGMHHHYYSGREVYARLADGSLRPSNVLRAYQAYAADRSVNATYPGWPRPAPTAPAE